MKGLRSFCFENIQNLPASPKSHSHTQSVCKPQVSLFEYISQLVPELLLQVHASEKNTIFGFILRRKTNLVQVANNDFRYHVGSYVPGEFDGE